MKKRFNNKKINGFMMVEVLVVSAIISASVLASMAVAQKAIMLSYQSLHTAEASFLLEEGAETVRILRDNNTWANFSSFFNTSSTYCLSSSVSSWTQALPTTSPCPQIGIFTRTINVASVNRDATSGDIATSGNTDSGTKLITITVSWAEHGKAITKTLQFYIMDIFS